MEAPRFVLWILPVEEIEWLSSEGNRYRANSLACWLHVAMRDDLFSLRPAFPEIQRGKDVLDTTRRSPCIVTQLWK
jgi:hypothetical protein